VESISWPVNRRVRCDDLQRLKYLLRHQDWPNGTELCRSGASYGNASRTVPAWDDPKFTEHRETDEQHGQEIDGVVPSDEETTSRRKGSIPSNDARKAIIGAIQKAGCALQRNDLARVSGYKDGTIGHYAAWMVANKLLVKTPDGYDLPPSSV